MKKIIITVASLLTIGYSLLTNSAKAQIITTFCGNGTAGYSGDGSAAMAAELNTPISIVFDSIGNLYITDEFNNRIRKVNTSGIITTIAGTGTAGYSGDNAAATTAELNGPEGIAFDKVGNLYIVDESNDRIRKINTAGIITTIAGTGTAGYSGDGGAATAAEIYGPLGITMDDTENIYVSDGNNTVRKINTSGIITTIAGTGTVGYSGDGGQATNAQLRDPRAIKFDKAGNLFISDAINYRIRKINTVGIITTIAGAGTSGYSGDGGQATLAQLDAPGVLVFDNAGNLYFTDEWNNVVRKIDTAGIITTIVGTGTAGYNGDGIAATAAELNVPVALAFDKQGNLYIGDDGNNRVRRVSNVGVMGVNELRIKNDELRIYPNPASTIINLSISQFGNSKINNIEIFNMMGECVHRQIVPSANCQIDVADLAEGAYNISISSKEGVLNKRLVIVR